MRAFFLYLFVVFLGVCALLQFVETIDPAEPALLVDATPAAAPLGVPTFACTYILPPLDKTRRGINRA